VHFLRNIQSGKSKYGLVRWDDAPPLKHECERVFVEEEAGFRTEEGNDFFMEKGGRFYFLEEWFEEFGKGYFEGEEGMVVIGDFFGHFAFYYPVMLVDGEKRKKVVILFNTLSEGRDESFQGLEMCKMFCGE